jgi:hypothetical protein
MFDTLQINDRIMTEWFYVTALGDQNLILGLPWLEKHNPIIDWMEKTLEFRNSQEDKVKAFIRSLAQEQEETMLIEDKDLVVWYLKSHRGPKPSDQLYMPFEDIGRWNKEQPDIAIRNSVLKSGLVRFFGQIWKDRNRNRLPNMV